VAGQPGPPGQAPPDPVPADPAGPGLAPPGEPPGPHQPTDADLLRGHVSGDREAFGILFLRHRERLWAVAVRTLGDPDEAADALQDAMISAFRRAADFRGDSAVTTWLHRIVVNACLDRMRRRAVRPAASGMDEPTLDAAARGSAVADPGVDKDTKLDVLAALRTLAPEQRAALVLVDMLGYPVADTAEILGISIGTVKSRCARGRARLLPLLAHLRGGPATDRGAQAGAGAGAGAPAAAGSRAGEAARHGAPAGQPAAGRNQPGPPRVSPPEGAGENRA
jgi:RNA polymerase sigma-70 factor, ECF subfamily